METPELWIETSFVPNPEELFGWFAQNVEWDERMRARKTVSYGVPYNYSNITYPEALFPDVLRPVLLRLEVRLGYVSNNCLVNYYPDGSSRMGFHSDVTENLERNSGIAIMSLGAERSLTFQSRTDKQKLIPYLLPSGSLLFMTALTQSYWKHGLLEEEQVGARISLTFRRLRHDSSQ